MEKRFGNNNNFRSNNFRGRTGTATEWQRQLEQRQYGWYNGHRGYRYRRSGYRYHNGFWFPAGAFIAGAIIGGAIANSNNGYYTRSAAAAPTCSGATTAIVRTGLRTTRSSPTTARASSAIRPIADSG